MVLLPDSDTPNDSAESETAFNTDFHSYFAPDYVFLVEHAATGNMYMFDLGIRKDLKNLPPLLKETVLPKFKCEPMSPADILKKHGSAAQQPEHVKAVIFSHMHFDHVGDGAKAGFGNAELWVGPTCCTYARPGYPVEQKAPTLSETLPNDFSRKIVETFVTDEQLEKAGDKRVGLVEQGEAEGKYRAVDLIRPDWIALGSFDRGYDVFGDGAAYLIDAPGHSAGHQMMLLRTKAASAGDTFVLLAGDAFHHPELLGNPQRVARPPFSKSGMHSDPDVAIDTIWRLRAFAGQNNVWVVAAHDFSVGENIEAGKRVIDGLVQINDWKERGWKNHL
ncbi:hypothetical protein IQ07DRAFT_590796 [Pyrenochaeta sp. DS3sAY3a]|nr:hypothetical protein IQ07DRAFT_590796 [Pyrenochaeta sp. DS3sAY3a]